MAAETSAPKDGPLVDAVRAELVSLRWLGTTDGQLALSLARGVERRPSAGLAGQLREVMAHVRFKAAQQGR